MDKIKKVEKKTIVLLLNILAVVELVVGILVTLFALFSLQSLAPIVLYSGIILIVSSLFTSAFARIVVAAELYIENNK